MSCSSVRTTSAPSVGARVAPVEKAVDGDRGDPVADAQLDAGEQMPVERVHAARTQQADEVERAAALPHAGAQLDQRRELVELAALDALGDADEVLGNHPAGAEVQVADFAVPHLAFGKADGEAAGVQQGARIGLPEPVPDRGGGQLDRVPFAFGPVAPAVQHHQDDPVPGTSV